MKKVITAMVLLTMIFGVSSCYKESTYCASCTELNSGYQDEYCGTQKDADAYVSTLNTFQGQNWSCKRTIK